MNKKLTDLMEEIQEDLIKEMIEETEVETVEAMPGVSIDRIKALATRHIEKMPKNESVSDEVYKSNKEIDLEAKETRQAKKRDSGNKTRKTINLFTKRLLIPLVAATLVVGAVAAVNYNPTLKNIFGEFFPFKDQVQPIEKSMSANGLTFTAQGALIDKKTGLFIASFTKDDGSIFEEDSEVKQMQVRIEKPGGMGWGVQSSLSEDKKQLNCIVDLSSSEKLYGQELTLEANDIRVWKNLSKISDIKLDNLKTVEIKQPWKNETSATGLNLNLVKDFKEIQLDAFNVSDKGIELITSYYDQEKIEDQTTFIEIIDERTNQSYEPTHNEHYWSEKEALNKDYYVFNQFTKEDFPYLKFKVGNNYYENILEGKWQVEFQLDKNSQTKTKHVYQIIQDENQRLVITKIEVSVLGVTLEGYRGAKRIDHLKEIYLKMKDGTRINLNKGGMSAGITFNMYYNVMRDVDNKEEQHLNEKEDLVGSSVGKIISNTSDLLTYDFINIDEVKSIVIEGKEIFLK